MGFPATYSTYASTEMQSSFTECNEFHGGHLQPELIIVEFLDDNNQPGKRRGSRRSDHHDFGSKRNAAAPFQDRRYLLPLYRTLRLWT